MRWGVLAFLAGCNFSVSSTATPDVMPDVPTDSLPATPRVAGERGIWRFDEGAGSSILDHATPPTGFGPMHLTVDQSTAVAWVDGGLKINSRATIASSITPNIGRLITMSGAFTIEVWVSSSALDQGLGPPDGSAPDHGNVVSASGSILSYSALIGQVGDKWIGRSRSMNTGTDAMPEISATPNTVVVNKVTHLVLVANSAARILYVDGTPFSSSPTGAGNVDWDESYRIRLGDAIDYDRQWLGTLWYMAMYDRALSETEVKQNFAARHDCTGC